MVVINNLYNTFIESDTYSFKRASSSSKMMVTLTVTLLDFNDVPVKNETVTIIDNTVNRNGETNTFKFDDTEYTGSITGTTDNNGVFSCQFYMGDMGLHELECNNESIQVYCYGYPITAREYVKDSSDDYVKILDLAYNSSIVSVDLVTYKNPLDVVASNQTNAPKNYGLNVPSFLAPVGIVTYPLRLSDYNNTYHYSDNGKNWGQVSVFTDGIVKYQTDKEITQSKVSGNTGFTYPRKPQE